MLKLDNKIRCGDSFNVYCNEAINSANSCVVSFVNPFSYKQLLNEPSLIEHIDSFFVDGFLLVRFHSLFVERIRRASFDYSSIASDFFHLAIEKNASIAVIGAKEEELVPAVQTINTQFPALDICYARNGYIDDKEAVLQELDKTKPRIVLLGMGTPYQERFATFLKANLKQPTLVITCGGFLTQTSIRADYYHPLVKKLGLRWLQRMIMHQHVRERVVKEYPKFVLHYVSTHLQSKAKGNGQEH